MYGIEHSTGDAKDREAALAVVVIALSAGGLAPLRRVVAALPLGLNAAVIVAQHVSGLSVLPQILAFDTRMPVTFACSGDQLRAGTIYVCPGDRHVIVNPDATLTLSLRERVNHFRPNGDWLFTSAASSFRQRTVGVVLSGYQDDGAIGALAIRSVGGVVIAQSPSTCEREEMPTAAIRTGAVDFVLPPDRIAAVVSEVVARIDLSRCRAEWDAPFASHSPSVSA